MNEELFDGGLQIDGLSLVFLRKADELIKAQQLQLGSHSRLNLWISKCGSDVSDQLHHEWEHLLVLQESVEATSGFVTTGGLRNVLGSGASSDQLRVSPSEASLQHAWFGQPSGDDILRVLFMQINCVVHCLVVQSLWNRGQRLRSTARRVVLGLVHFLAAHRLGRWLRGLGASSGWR
jgi:hypothetical protein